MTAIYNDRFDVAAALIELAVGLDQGIDLAPVVRMAHPVAEIMLVQIAGNGADAPELGQIARALGARAVVLPMCEEVVQTRVLTPGGWVGLQEYLIVEGSEPAIEGIEAAAAMDAIMSGDIQLIVNTPYGVGPRLDGYEIREGSGGAGRWHGGNGGIRRVRFLEAMTASILSNGRIHGAFGMAGGQPGAVGINRVVRADGRTEDLAHIGQASMAPGDVFEIHTPGGGGFGE